jgi:tetratricopeptide (TPR) repeat protein
MKSSRMISSRVDERGSMRKLIKMLVYACGVLFLAGFYTACGASSEVRDDQGISKGSAQAPKPAPEAPKENKVVFNEAVASYQKELAKQAIDYERLLKIFDAAIDKDSKLAEAYYNLGCVYEAMQDDKKAKENYEEALKIKPDLALAAASLGAILARQGDLDQALELFKRSLVKDSKNSAVLLKQLLRCLFVIQLIWYLTASWRQCTMIRAIWIWRT